MFHRKEKVKVMKLFAANSTSNVDALKVRNSEKYFYRYMADTLKGYGITKVVPFTSVYADLFYLEKGKIGLFKFMDTNEEAFSILGEEIAEIMEEERDKLFEMIKEQGILCEIPCFYIMPYVDLEAFGMEDKRSYIIDREPFERLINQEDAFSNYLSDTLDTETMEHIRLTLAKDYHIFKKSTDNRNARGTMKKIFFPYKELSYQALFMDANEIRYINSIKYGKTLLEGSSGTGKTTILFSRAIKLAKLFPNDHFLYFTFDKQLVYELNNMMEMKKIRLDNLKVINFHQYIAQLGKPYGLRIDGGKGYRSFAAEFHKIFRKVTQIYKEKPMFRGIFLDESENFSDEEIDFLSECVYPKKSFFVVSQDKAKDIKNTEQSIWKGTDRVYFDEVISLKVNYRSSVQINTFVNDFTEKVRSYAEEQLDTDLYDYIRKGYTRRKTLGEIHLIESLNTAEMLKKMGEKIRELEKKGYIYSDICIVYPYNSRKTKNKGQIFYQYMIKNALEEMEIPFLIANDEMINMTHKIGVTLSNVYNIGNLEFKAVLFCETESLSSDFAEESMDKSIFLRGINVLYTIFNRSVDEMYIFTREEETDNCWKSLMKEAFYMRRQ